MPTATPAKIVDASAVAAILFNEPGLDDVQAALRGAQLIAPYLLIYELGNVCRTKCRQHPDDQAALESGLALFPKLGIRESPVEPPAVLTLALAKQITFYDASYLWLARTHGLELVTLDKRLRNAAAP